jgi:hypothetical protein
MYRLREEEPWKSENLFLPEVKKKQRKTEIKGPANAV